MKEVKILFENYIQPILIDQDGINFILESDFNNLVLSLEEKKNLLLYLENLNIGIVSSSFSNTSILNETNFARLKITRTPKK